MVELLRQQQLTCFDNPYRTSFFSSTYADSATVAGVGNGVLMTAYIQHAVLAFTPSVLNLHDRATDSPTINLLIHSLHSHSQHRYVVLVRAVPLCVWLPCAGCSAVCSLFSSPIHIFIQCISLPSAMLKAVMLKVMLYVMGTSAEPAHKRYAVVIPTRFVTYTVFLLLVIMCFDTLTNCLSQYRALGLQPRLWCLCCCSTPYSTRE